MPDTDIVPARSPSAVDKRAEEIKVIAREMAEDALAALGAIINDPDAKEAARVRAAEIVLNRGFGAPERKVEQRVDVTIYDERAAHLNALRMLADRKAAKAEKERNTRPDVIDAEFEEITPSKRK